ncbi:MAG TPA: hypothetical protein PKJ96_06500 [Thiobacillaceae bacterium]|nr:hypothetical protein [Thiobacillaceae bacterium]
MKRAPLACAMVLMLGDGVLADELVLMRFPSGGEIAVGGEGPRLILLEQTPAGVGLREPAAAAAMPPAPVLLRMTDARLSPTKSASRPVAALTDAGLPLKTSLTLGVGPRRDDLRWSIADVDGSPDVLSELTWRDQKSLMLNVRGEVVWPSGWLLTSEAGLGAQLQGEVQDSDYDADGRTQEWSRSVGQADDGDMLDVLLTGGHRFHFGAHTLGVRLGYAWHDQNLRFSKATQVVAQPNSFGFTLPPVGTTFDAMSSYSASWWGPHLALDLDLALGGGWRLGLSAWREWVDYEGTGNWALRSEFDHPESFTHLAEGRITGLKAGLTRNWGKSGRLGLAWERVRGRTDSGTDITHFTGMGNVPTGLNEVLWDSEIWKLELAWTF